MGGKKRENSNEGQRYIMKKKKENGNDGKGRLMKKKENRYERGGGWNKDRSRIMKIMKIICKKKCEKVIKVNV